MLALLATACARLPIAKAIPTRDWSATASHPDLVAQVDSADGYVLGVVEKAEPDGTYDTPCGLLAGLLGQCDGTHAYRLTVRHEGGPSRLYVFVPAGDSLALPVGTRAVFIWRTYYAARLHQCRAQSAMTMAYCPADPLVAVLSRDAVVAPGDSLLVARLFASLKRRGS